MSARRGTTATLGSVSIPEPPTDDVKGQGITLTCGVARILYHCRFWAYWPAVVVSGCRETP